MSTSNKFVANGAAHMAFATGGARIDYGVNAQGSHCGVYGGASTYFPRETAIPGVGVWGDGRTTGVHGRGDFDQSNSVGVLAEASAIGLRAETAYGRGGTFMGQRAQVRLVPLEFRPEEGIRSVNPSDYLPEDGKAGDLLAVSIDGGLNASLWFCGRGAFEEEDGSVVPASWNLVTMGGSTTGHRTVPPT